MNHYKVMFLRFFLFNRAQHEIVQSNIDVLVNTGLGERGSDDALLVKDTCTVLLNLNKDNEKV